MSKIVEWGHWVVAALFALGGIELVWRAIVTFPRVFREHPNDVTYRIVSGALFWLAILICAWGIAKWRQWARSLGIVICIANLLGAFLVPRQIGLQQFYIVVSILVLLLIWFYIPRVKAQFVVRNRIV